MKRDYAGVLFNAAGVCSRATFLCVIIVKVRICRHMCLSAEEFAATPLQPGEVLDVTSDPVWRLVQLTAHRWPRQVRTKKTKNKNQTCDRVLWTQLWSLNSRDSKVVSKLVYFSSILPQISLSSFLLLSVASSRNKHKSSAKKTHSNCYSFIVFLQTVQTLYEILHIFEIGTCKKQKKKLSIVVS